MFTKGYAGPVEVVTVGIAPDELLLESIQAAVDAHDVQNGAVVSGIGTLKFCRMHHIKHSEFPPDDRFYEIEEPLEVSNISGIIADGEPHLHMTVGFRDEWSLAGHLEPGCVVLYLAEVVILKFNDLRMARHFDETRKISLLGDES
jgi:uncharacterized protein